MIDEMPGQDSAAIAFAYGSRSASQPTTFAVQDEGQGLYALFLAPCAPATIAPALNRLGIHELLDTTPRWGLGASRVVPTDALVNDPSLSTPPLDLVHAPGATTVSDLLIMADPHRAVPTDGQRRLAFCLSEDGHGIVYSRDLGVLAEVLRDFLEGVLPAPVRREVHPPRISETLLASVLEPVSPECWREARVLVKREHVVLALSMVGLDGAHRKNPRQQTRWVIGRSAEFAG